MLLAVTDYDMINTGDRIVVGISGRQRQPASFHCHAGNFRRFLPEKFDLIGITIDLGFENYDREILRLLLRIFRSGLSYRKEDQHRPDYF